MSRPTRQRCEECGAFAHERLTGGRPIECRTLHPESALIEWPHPGGATAKRPLVSVAYELLCRKSREGVDLDRWIEDVPEGEHHGCTKAQLALALVYARRWKLEEFNDSDLPEVLPKVTLFGYRRQAS